MGRRTGRPRRGQTEDVLDALYDLGETVPVKTTEAHRRWPRGGVGSGRHPGRLTWPPPPPG
ncbi:hypothetical protein ABZX66_26875 [Micromonospora aurantiaca]|uniref:hypothetical protein n=1 Tax=Micromonospora aurantiaca (nom. illeg.) TaxID=47850 RepID=UPI0033A0F5E6